MAKSAQLKAKLQQARRTADQAHKSFLKAEDTYAVLAQREQQRREREAANR